MIRIITLILLLTTLFSQEQLSVKKIMAEPFLWGDRVQSFAFSDDSKNLFLKEKAKQVYRIDLNDYSKTDLDTAIKAIPRNWVSSNTFLLRKNGRIYDATLSGAEQKLVYDTKSFGSDKRVSFTASRNHGTDLILVDNRLIVKRNNRLSTLELKSDDHKFYVASISESGRFAVLAKYKRRAERNYTLYFPNYLPTFTKDGKEPRGINHYELILVDFDDLEQSSIYVQKEGGFISNVKFFKEDRFVFIDHPVDRRSVEFYKHNLNTHKTNKIYQSTSAKWAVGSYHTIKFSPDGKSALFIALHSGFERLFTHNFSRSKNKTLSTGLYQVTFASWLDNNTIITVSNEANPTERRINKVSAINGNKTRLKHSLGFIDKIQLSKDKKHLAYEFSSLAKPAEVYSYLISEQKEVKISSTTPEDFFKLGLKQHEIIKSKSADKKFDIYANFYSAGNTKRPLVVFVHGAGIMQNVRNGWTPYYYREYMFNQMLVQKGYNVLDVDYRGSKGYSNNFATDVYSHLGKKELEDIVSFIEKLDKEGKIDKNRVGIYGGSYGGFMASYALAFQPDLFKAAAALRSVFKWENYFYTNEWYTRARLGLLEVNPTWYKRSSPVYHAKKMKNPMLILHGMLDNNVPFQDAVQMVQEMIDHEKKFDLMIYPKEKHSFRHSKSWIDEYTRIFNYFETYLKESK